MTSSSLPTRGLSVAETAGRLAVYAYVLSRTTRLLGSWASETPEIELKILGGRHIHQDATAVSSLEARVDALVHDRSLCATPPRGPWSRSLAALGGHRSSLHKLHGMYEVVKHALQQEIERHIHDTHHVWDEPTVVILQQIVRDLAEQRASAALVRQQVSALFYPDVVADAVEAEWQCAVDRADPSGEPEYPLPSVPGRDHRFSFIGDTPPFDLREPKAVIGALHRMLMSIEIPTIEVCGRMIAESADMPWDFVLDMSRQSWDEARHAVLCYDRILQLGGRIGQCPINLQMWQLSYGLTLPLRLAVHQRLGEWLGVDGAMAGMVELNKAGDQITARSIEYVIVDEVAHVSYGNKWIRHLVQDDEDVHRVHEQAVARRESFGQTVNGAPELPLNVQLCELAGFTADEIRLLQDTRNKRRQPSHAGA